MRNSRDLSSLGWQLTGWIPFAAQVHADSALVPSSDVDVSAIPAQVPGSAQSALRESGIIPDWNIGLNSRLCEWVENRDWLFAADIPDEWVKPGKSYRLECKGLDYSGYVLVNGIRAGDFKGSLIPHTFDISALLKETGNRIGILFQPPPRWLGQYGRTCDMTEWKPRFNYTWDWTNRVVQIGIWDHIALVESDGCEITEFRCYTEPGAAMGQWTVKAFAGTTGESASSCRLEVRDGEETLATRQFPLGALGSGVELECSGVETWWPNLEGEQPLYTIKCTLLDGAGAEIDCVERRIGFKSVEWRQCEGAPEAADPWICVVNGKPIFLQGVNWTPIRPNFADVTVDDYRKRLQIYKDLGCNVLRVWGGAFLEKECFYDLCDEMGLLVWQEFPLSSSGISNWPPEDEKSIAELSEIARSYITRRQHHASLLLWCGGNELQGALDGGKDGIGKPVDLTHPLLARFAKIVAEMDPTKRFLPTSSSGPRFYAEQKDYGKGIHWDVHGPWKVEGDIEPGWVSYWAEDDSLLRSELGAPGASSVEILRRYLGDCSEMPVSGANPYWRRPVNWWVESGQFAKEHGREPMSVEEYVEWSQERQRKALSIAVGSSKGRFPKCGGSIIWMGHDSFPCAANTAIVDFDGNPKPAALALSEIWRGDKGKL